MWRNRNNWGRSKPVTTPHNDRTCLISPPKPCRTKGEVDERHAHPDNHEEPGVSQTDCRPRDVGSVHTPQMLPQIRGQSHHLGAPRREDFYPWNKQSQNHHVCKRKKVESNIDLWHKRFGHVNFPRVWEMQTKNIVYGLPKFTGRNGQVCEACELGKQNQLPFPNEQNRSQK